MQRTAYASTFAAATLLSLSALWAARPTSGTPSTEKKLIEAHTLTPEDQARIGSKNAWIAAAKKISDRTQNEEAKKIAESVLPYLLTVTPYSKGFHFLEAGKTPPSVAFFPLVPADLLKPYLTRLTSGRHTFSQYEPQENLLIVNDFEPCSDFWKGMSLLREGQHAETQLSVPYNTKDSWVFSEHQRNAFSFEDRLMSKIGGSAYEELLDREIVRIRADAMKRGSKGFKSQPGSFTMVIIPQRGPYNPELDKIFTPALSETERENRQTNFWIHAVFKAYEEDSGKGPDADFGKALFIQTLYQQANVFRI